MRKAIAIGGAALVAVLAAGPALAAEVPENIEKECMACHQLSGMAGTDLAARQTRKGPPLYYAGNKFRRGWLESWLRKPTQIRPAGDFPPDHVATGANGDVVDEKTLPKHPVVTADEAGKIADFLMTLTPHSDLLAQEKYTPGRVPERMGAMDFVKFKGCGGCHRDTPKYGGVSGPELYTAWQRLQPEFIVSYVRNPTAWEHRSLMPNKHLNDAGIHKLADYLRTIGEKTEQSK